MRLRFIAQPDAQVGAAVMDLLERRPLPRSVTVVSAFTNHQTLMRMRATIADLVTAGCSVRVVVGIDLGGSTVEALGEIVSWGVDAMVVNHPQARTTFHPKIYLAVRDDCADLLIGSSNLTDGGFYTNYEGVAHVTYALPDDQDAYQSMLRELSRFLDPQGPTALPLDAPLIALLQARGDIPDNAARQATRRAQARRGAGPRTTASPFGAETIPPPPPVPRLVLDQLIATRDAAARASRAAAGTPGAANTVGAPVQIAPVYFYMTLPVMRGANNTNPGEPRVPLAARDIATDFWFWPDAYSTRQSATGRVYVELYSPWTVLPADNPSAAVTEVVRLYYYSASEDFRFYSPALLALGASPGDIVRITRSEDPISFELALARAGTPLFAAWSRYLVEEVRGTSPRRWGYA